MRHPVRQADERAEAVHQSLDLVAGCDELRLHVLVHDDHGAVRTRHLAHRPEHGYRLRHVVDAFEGRHEVVVPVVVGVGRRHRVESHPVGDAFCLGVSTRALDGGVVQIEPVHRELRVCLRQRDRRPAAPLAGCPPGCRPPHVRYARPSRSDPHRAIQQWGPCLGRMKEEG